MSKKPINKHAPLVYVRWLDANYQEGDLLIEELDVNCELDSVGFLVKETPDAIVLSVENPRDGFTRNPFAILKANILERREQTITRAFPKPRVKRVLCPIDPSG